MTRCLIGLILIAALVACPHPSVSIVVKKDCCRSNACTSDCSRHGDGKCDCCGWTVVSVPLVPALANTEIFEHPVQSQKPLIWFKTYSARFEAPLLPPPKVV
jgi:hypothetical protein